MTERPMKTKQYEKRFRIIAIEKGFISRDDLIKAIMIQAQEEIENDTHRFMAEIMLYEDMMSANQIEEVVKAILSY